MKEAQRDPDARVRHEAIIWADRHAPDQGLVQRLVQAAPAQGKALLNELLKDPDPDARVRLRLVRALGSASPEGARAAVSLLNELREQSYKDNGIDVLDGPMADAAEALSIRGARAGFVAPKLSSEEATQLLEELRHPNPLVRSVAVERLLTLAPGPFGPAVAPSVAAKLASAAPQLARQLTSPSARAEAVQALSALGAVGDVERSAVGRAAAAQASQVAALLNAGDTAVRLAAVNVLSAIGSAAGPYAPQLAALLGDRDAQVRDAAVQVLGGLGPAAAAYAPQVAALIIAGDDASSGDAARALGKMGPAGVAFAPQLVDLLKSRETAVAALMALQTMGSAAAPQVAARLKVAVHERWSKDALAHAVQALRGTRSAAAAQELADLLTDPDANARWIAVDALKGMDLAGAVPVLQQVGALLKDPDMSIRRGAVLVLAAHGSAATAFAPEVAALLKVPDRLEQDDGYIYYQKRLDAAALRGDAARALGAMGSAGAAFAPQVAELMTDADQAARTGAAQGLAGMGAAAAPYLAALLQDEDEGVRRSVRFVLDSMTGYGPLQTRKLLLALLDAARLWRGEQAGFLMRAYLYRTANPDDLILIRWLGDRDSAAPPASPRQVLQAFSRAWDDSREFPDLRGEMARRTAELTRLPVWYWWRDAAVFAELKGRFAAAGLKDQESVLDSVLARWFWYQKLQQTTLILGAHLSAWLLLLFAYPRSRWVQGLFFWNKWGRRFLGLGYVGLCITLIPWLRRRMFEPFRESLVPRGVVAQLSERSYFPDSEVVRETYLRAERKALPVKEVLGRIQGQVVLKGHSGLGKTLLLARLALTAREPVVFLRATECKGGVDAAIEKKLHGQLRDRRYLETLIYAGALKVLIDGVNEASPEARFAITEFVEKHFKGDIVLTTQPMSRESWEPPAVAVIYVLQPLRLDQIEPFLRTQWDNVASAAQRTREQYEQHVQHYVEVIRQGRQDVATIDPRLTALTNPMDALLAAELLARGATPDVFSLVEQRYRVMAETFREEHGREFPLQRFSHAVYEWRKSGEPYLDPRGFEEEVAALAEDRLMIQRTEVQKTGDGEQRVNRWFFRHDKIMEFFLLPAFMGAHKASPRYDHLDDYGPFIGVYELLAVSLPDDAEEELYQRLADKAADTGSNELLNHYTLARRLRQLARSGAGATPAPHDSEPKRAPPNVADPAAAAG